VTAWLLAALSGAVCAGGGAVLYLRRRYVVISVTGESMTPGLRHGDRLLMRRGPASRIRSGAVVVLRTPLGPALKGYLPSGFAAVMPGWSVKRVAAMPRDRVPDSVRPAVGGAAVVPAGMLVVLADNPRGTDSRRWGFVPLTDVLGSVIWTFSSRGKPPVRP
jgi:signal peptidase I